MINNYNERWLENKIEVLNTSPIIVSEEMSYLEIMKNINNLLTLKVLMY